MTTRADMQQAKPVSNASGSRTGHSNSAPSAVKDAAMQPSKPTSNPFTATTGRTAAPPQSRPQRHAAVHNPVVTVLAADSIPSADGAPGTATRPNPTAALPHHGGLPHSPSASARDIVRSVHNQYQTVPVQILELLVDKTFAKCNYEYERHRLNIAGIERKIEIQLEAKEKECKKLWERLMVVEKSRSEEKGRADVEKKNLMRQLEEGETDIERKERERSKKEEMEKEKELEDRANRALLEEHEKKKWAQEREQWNAEKAGLLTQVESLEQKVRTMQDDFEKGVDTWSKKIENFVQEKEATEMELERVHEQHLEERATWQQEKAALAESLRAERVYSASIGRPMAKRKRDEEGEEVISEPAAKQRRLEQLSQAEGLDEAEEDHDDLEDCDDEEVEEGADETEEDNDDQEEEEEGLEEEEDFEGNEDELDYHEQETYPYANLSRPPFSTPFHC